MYYHTCTYYSCLLEDEPLGSKRVHVEDIMKIELNLVSKGAFCWFTLYNYWSVASLPLLIKERGT
jgi:hypothetical protein